MKRALIVIDGSDTALRAVHQFADLASGRPGVQAMLMHVEPPLPLLDRIVGGSPDNVLRFRQPLRDKGEKLVAPAKAELERVGVRCSIAIEFGDPAATILARAEDWRADLRNL